MVDIKKINKNSVADQVFDQIREHIINGAWTPGQKIPSENEFVKMFGVSRITVREALQRLSTLGLLESRRGEGTFVKERAVDIYMNSLIPMIVLNKTSIIHIVELRRVIEIETVGLAVDRATEEDMDKLERTYESMKECVNDTQKFADEDLNFHMALAEITRNPLIIKVNYIIKDVLNSSMGDIIKKLGTEDGLEYHDKIIKAIRDRDKNRAKGLMVEHIDRTIERLSQLENEIVERRK